MKRVYLDWNATAPLRPEARAAMLAAMDCVGNPSSVHAEGRAARAIVEKARGQVADLVGCDRDEVVFTSGATEAALLAFHYVDQVFGAPIEHSCVWRFVQNSCADEWSEKNLKVSRAGQVSFDGEPRALYIPGGFNVACLQASNGETGIIQAAMPKQFDPRSVVCDMVQSVGKTDVANCNVKADKKLISGHKFGGPKGVGALIIAPWAADVLAAETPFPGGGQEMGRRSGTENVIGIAGMGAAAEAAAKDLAEGVWQIVEQNRNVFEERLLNEVPELIIFGKDVERLPNTSYFAVPGWKAETQVMQMDLAGFAVSAGSACSSGKVKASRVLRAMGYDELTAGSAIRVSIGPGTTAAELESFADAWLGEYKRFKARREGK